MNCEFCKIHPSDEDQRGYRICDSCRRYMNWAKEQRKQFRIGKCKCGGERDEEGMCNTCRNFTYFDDTYTVKLTLSAQGMIDIYPLLLTLRMMGSVGETRAVMTEDHGPIVWDGDGASRMDIEWHKEATKQ